MIDKKEIEGLIKSLKKSGIDLFPNLAEEQKRQLLHIEDDESRKLRQGSADATA